MRTLIIDTNGYLRWLLNDISSQADQISQLLHLAQQGKIRIVIPEIVVFEMVFILIKYYGFSKELVIQKLEVLLSTSYLEIHKREVLLSALKLYQEKKVSLSDCYLAALSTAESLELITFDKQLQKLVSQTE